MKTIVYSLNDIQRIVLNIGLERIMDDAIAALEHAFVNFSPEEHVIPARGGFDYSQPNVGLIEWMPALKTDAGMVLKMVGYHPGNPAQQGLPTILSTTLAFDTNNGHLTAIMDGNFLTAVRTGAASAIASKVLARPDATVLGIIGCGAQAVTQLHALSRVFPLQQVLIFDEDPAALVSFVGRTEALGLQGVDIIPTALERLVGSADILCTCTSVDVGGGPVFADHLLSPSLHINAVGSDFPGKTEIPLSLLQRSLVCPDFLSQAENEGECQQLEAADIGPDLVTLLKGREHYESFRHNPTVFDSTGWALEDHVAMNQMLTYGKELGLGSEVTLANVGDDPHNPYAAFATAQRQSRKVR